MGTEAHRGAPTAASADEDYLRALAESLHCHGMPRDKIVEICEEVRCHLHYEVLERMRRGEAPDQAAGAAVQHFGPVAGLARELAQVHLGAPEPASAALWPCLRMLAAIAAQALAAPMALLGFCGAVLVVNSLFPEPGLAAILTALGAALAAAHAVLSIGDALGR